MRVRAIVNPRAGRGSRRAAEALFRVRGVFEGAEVATTSRPGEARDLARDAAEEGCDVVLVAGGDGTTNEVAWGLLGSTTTLGLIPAGSGNGLGRVLGIPLDPDRALAALASAETRLMDVGFVNGRPFLNVAGAGFDAAVGAAFQARGREGGTRSVFGYLQLGLRKSWDYRAGKVVLEAGGERFEGRALVVAFLNGRQYGGGAVVAPRALLDDGLLDCVIFEETPLLETLANVPRLFLGGIESFRAYRHIAAHEATLMTEKPLEHHRDGEPEAETSRLEVRLESRALRVLVPTKVLLDPAGAFASTERATARRAEAGLPRTEAKDAPHPESFLLPRGSC